MININKNSIEMVSITDVKKAPMKIINISEEKNIPIHILNKNKEVGVILNIDNYKEIVEFISKAYEIIDNKNEEIYQEKIFNRIKKESSDLLSNEDVVGEDWKVGLDEVLDEWE